MDHLSIILIFVCVSTLITISAVVAVYRLILVILNRNPLRSDRINDLLELHPDELEQNRINLVNEMKRIEQLQTHEKELNDK